MLSIFQTFKQLTPQWQMDWNNLNFTPQWQNFEAITTSTGQNIVIFSKQTGKKLLTKYVSLTVNANQTTLINQ